MISYNEFKKMELKVGRVVSATDHPNADKLIVMQVDIGGEQRQMVAGLKQWYTADDLVGKSIVAVVNLEPAVLRGEKSEGMLLAAQDGGSVVILVPEKDVAPGSPIL